MAVTKEQLRTEVGAGPGDDALLERCLAEAVEDITTYLADNDVLDTDLPPTVLDRAVRVAAADAFHTSKAPNGIANQEFDVGNGEISSTPIRVSRDPLRGARRVLELYVGPVIA
ncbi:hypothetical protein ASE01_20080 [Nocardioides sp. Root190]|uniref:hypothetical protein n=1 Tax=Nocardioides sp. Root190 TaxID=1736488 RepID=UPI0006F7F45C|nr:hypothetical protein [Nocardioides sp. Root190]KRB73076.1 hypothetical protein ASE01_20080 [Nocardioides sp. Root190]